MQHYSYNAAPNTFTPHPFLLASGGAFIHPTEASVMAAPISANPPLTMSSLDISELTGKRHDHVMKDIRKMRKELNINAPEVSGTYRTTQGNTYKCSYLQRREVDILLTGYSASLRAKVIDRWRELEDQPATQKFSPLIALDSIRKLAADWEADREMMARQVKTLTIQIARDAPKAEFYDEMVNTSQLFNSFEVANFLDTGRTRLLKFMREHKILMSNVHRMNMPYQRYKNAGLLEVKASGHKNRATGEIEIKSTTLFTGKGVIWLQKYIARHGRIGL